LTPALRSSSPFLYLGNTFKPDYVARTRVTCKDKRRISVDRPVDLLHYEWPGNIRELQNVIERSVIVCSSEVFSIDESWLSKGSLGEHLAFTPRHLSRLNLNPQSEAGDEAALAASRRQVSGPSGAVTRLGIPPSPLDHRTKALTINKNRFKFR
jgi:DNA-binding NtrC family response regulator